MTVNESLDKTQKRLLDFFFPRKCPFCGRMTGRELLCSRCKTELPRCDKLRTGSFGECAAPLYYEDNVRKAYWTSSSRTGWRTSTASAP